MHRSWGYIVMVVVTLAGAGGLLWPTPQSFEIEEISVEDGDRAGSSVRGDGGPDRAARPKPGGKKTPPAVQRIPPQNTVARRNTPAALQPSQPGAAGAARGNPSAVRPGGTPANR
jgi:hypothetical protein